MEQPIAAVAGSVYNPFVWGEPRSVVERFLLRVGMTCGKHAEAQQGHVDAFLDELCALGQSPVERLREIRRMQGHQRLLEMLKEFRIGRYTLVSRMLRDIAECPDILSLNRDQLCSITGFAMKSASLFKMFSDPYSGAVILDKQALKLTGDVIPESDDQYRQMELLFIKNAVVLREHPAILCFILWCAAKPREVWGECRRSTLAARRFLAINNEINDR